MVALVIANHLVTVCQQLGYLETPNLLVATETMDEDDRLPLALNPII